MWPSKKNSSLVLELGDLFLIMVQNYTKKKKKKVIKLMAHRFFELTTALGYDATKYKHLPPAYINM